MVTMGPIVAGSFYPADPDGLRAEVRRLLSEATPPSVAVVHGVIVPHAGYAFSGPVAASAYVLLQGRSFDRVVLVGPAHFVWFEGLATPAADTWSIPLGRFPITAADSVPRRQEPFANEHSLEVQLPFLYEVLGPVPLIPLLTGEVTAEDAAVVLDRLLDDGTLLVVSTDLSHYFPYDMARRLDTETAAAVVDGEPERLGREVACGRTGLQAAMLLARRRDWEVQLLDLRNSGDTAGDRSRVVGYGAFSLSRRGMP